MRDYSMRKGMGKNTLEGKMKKREEAEPGQPHGARKVP